MTPTLPAFLACAAFGLLCWLVGVAAGRHMTRREHAWDRAWLFHRIAELGGQLATTEQIIAGLTDQRLAVAGLQPMPPGYCRPHAWANLQQARENPRMN
jgi:hypothetical protein